VDSKGLALVDDHGTKRFAPKAYEDDSAAAMLAAAGRRYGVVVVCTTNVGTLNMNSHIARLIAAERRCDILEDAARGNAPRTVRRRSLRERLAALKRKR
jgi:hypothetical protein